MPEDLINNPPFDTISIVINEHVETGNYRILECGCIEFGARNSEAEDEIESNA